MYQRIFGLRLGMPLCYSVQRGPKWNLCVFLHNIDLLLENVNDCKISYYLSSCLGLHQTIWIFVIILINSHNFDKLMNFSFFPTVILIIFFVGGETVFILIQSWFIWAFFGIGIIIMYKLCSLNNCAGRKIWNDWSWKVFGANTQVMASN